MSDCPTQVVLGTFVAILACYPIVLRAIRGDDESDFVPSIALRGTQQSGATGLNAPGSGLMARQRKIRCAFEPSS